jgi:hypothetical protein
MNIKLKDARQASYNEWSSAAAQEIADLFAAVSRLDDSLNTGVMAYRGESCGEDFKKARDCSLDAKKALATCLHYLDTAMRTME